MKSTDAAAAAPGVTWGGAPGNPSQFVVRGFLSNQINVLRDGIYLGPSTMVTRPFNSFNLDSMQVMQGPASQRPLRKTWRRGLISAEHRRMDMWKVQRRIVMT